MWSVDMFEKESRKIWCYNGCHLLIFEIKSRYIGSSAQKLRLEEFLIIWRLQHPPHLCVCVYIHRRGSHKLWNILCNLNSIHCNVRIQRPRAISSHMNYKLGRISSTVHLLNTQSSWLDLTCSSLIATHEFDGNPWSIGTRNCRHPLQWPMRSIIQIKLNMRMKTDAMLRNCVWNESNVRERNGRENIRDMSTFLAYYSELVFFWFNFF